MENGLHEIIGIFGDNRCKKSLNEKPNESSTAAAIIVSSAA
jgi:hypothetical protein